MAETKAVAQSNMGTQIFYYDSASYKFKYLVPLTGDLPSMGSSPATIECTEMDSSVKQYIPDRVDSPSLEFTFNYLAEREVTVSKHLNPTKPSVFALLLPLGTMFVLEASGDVWEDGGSPIQGKFTLVQSGKAVMIGDITKTFTENGSGGLIEDVDKTLAILKAMGVEKSSLTAYTTSDKIVDGIDWETIPAEKMSQEPTV